MTTDFEQMLTGGHPNSLGRTEEVVDLVLAEPTRLHELYAGYFSADEVVRLRVASAMKRIAVAQPDLAMDIMDGLQGEVAAVDQASVQWTLALIFDITRTQLSTAQRARAIEIMLGNLATHDDWIVLNNSMKVLGAWSDDDEELRHSLRPHAQRLAGDPRTSVASNALKLLERQG